MNERANETDTRAQLIRAGIELFSSQGFSETSVRELTRAAVANLGAITYHFGSKAALYEAVFGAVAEPVREVLERAAAADGPPIDRIERCVRAHFAHLRRHPELPRLIVRQLAGSRPLPEAARRAMQGNIGLLAGLIAQGQRDGSIRAGDPRHLALSVAGQPIFLALMAPALREGAGIDPTAPATRNDVVESAVGFIRAGLAARKEEQA
jgi:AcrR family transcriptional regulator